MDGGFGARFGWKERELEDWRGYLDRIGGGQRVRIYLGWAVGWWGIRNSNLEIKAYCEYLSELKLFRFLKEEGVIEIALDLW